MSRTRLCDPLILKLFPEVVQPTGIQQAVSLAGSKSKLARELRVTQQGAALGKHGYVPDSRLGRLKNSMELRLSDYVTRSLWS